MHAHSSPLTLCLRLPQMNLTLGSGDEFWWMLERMEDDSRSGPCARWVREHASLFPNDDIWFCLVLFLSVWQVQRRQSIALSRSYSPLLVYVSVHSLFNLSSSIEHSFLILLCLTRLVSYSLCLLPPCHPLTLSSLTLSSPYLWITNDNGLCSLMWEFCNQPLCMAYALMALIFSDFNAPQDHQQWGERAHK